MSRNCKFDYCATRCNRAAAGAVGIPSASGTDWTEYRANRHAERYFRKRYGVDWTDYLTRYPLRRP